MSETRDKRRKSDLDLFVLALIRSGVATPYALHKEAGLSPGATVPAIQRLLAAGLIRQGSPGLRGRTDARITAAGKKKLMSGWRILIDDSPSGDLDADLRVALLAISEGNAQSMAANMLRQSAARMLEMGEAVPRDREAEIHFPLASVYRQLRSISGKLLLEAQAVAASAMADRLPKKLPQKRDEAGRSTAKKAHSARVKRLK